MNIEIESYHCCTGTDLTHMRKSAWLYSRSINLMLREGWSAPEAIRELRNKDGIVIQEVEAMTVRLGETDWRYRQPMVAAFVAIAMAYTKKDAVPTRIIQALGNAIAFEGMPQSLTFSIRGHGWLKINLVALYIVWARRQHQLVISRVQPQARRN